MTRLTACMVAGALALGSAVVEAAATARFDRLGVEQGLSQSTVQAILQDHVGFLWLGTEEGLNRYDGYSMVVFRHDPEDSRSLPDNRVTTLHEDAQSRLWVGTDSGLALFDRRTDAFDVVPDIRQRVTGIAEDSDGTLWVGVEGYGVYERAPQTEVFVAHMNDRQDPGSFSSYLPSELLRDRAGRLWIGTRDAGLERLEEPEGEGQSRRFAHYRHDPADPGSLGHDEVWALTEDGEGRLWVASYGGGLSVLDHDSEGFRHYRHRAGDTRSLPTDLVTALFTDRDGTVWIGTDGAGLLAYDAAGDRFRSFVHDPLDSSSISQDVVRTIHQDRQGQMWIGTYLGGVSVLRRPPHAFTYYTHSPTDPASLADRRVGPFLEDADGRLWVSTGESWLHLYERDSGSFVRYQAPSALSLLQDHRGRVWVGTYRAGLALLDLDRWTVVTYSKRPGDPLGLTNDEVWAMVEDDDGTLWLGTNRGLDRFDPDLEAVTERHDTPSAEGRGNTGVRALLRDRQGHLWVGSLGGLHVRRRGNNRLVRVRPDDRSLGQDGVGALHEDGLGRLWIGTFGGGLMRLDPATGVLTTFGGLPSNVVYAIEEEASGRLWVSGNNGLARLDPATGDVEHFDLSSGLHSLQFTLGASLETRDGRLLFGSADGFYDFDPGEIRPSSFAPPVVFTSLRVFNEPPELPASLVSLEEIVLSHRDDVVTIEFAALDYFLPRRNRYAYRMEGISDDWIDLDTRRDVTFVDLEPGTYRFRARASNSDGVWSEGSHAELRVVVRPPLWGTWWFRALAACTLVLGLALTHLVRVRRLTADLEEQRRTELALREAGQEVRHSLSVLQSTLESTADGILVVDRDGKVVSFNQRFVELWQVPYDLLESQDEAALLVHFEGQLRHPVPFAATLRALREQPEADSFDEIELADGRILERYSRPHRLDGAPAGRVWSFRDVTERRRAEERIEHQAYHDALTGLPNRLLLEDRLNLALGRAQRQERSLAAIVLDLDHFKLINDTLGHAAGDRLLEQVAERLQGCVRQEDTVARLGGDEFALLYSDLASSDDGPRLGAKALNAFAQPFVLEGQELYVTASVGVAIWPDDGPESEILLANADAAMYRAKELGRNNYQLFSPGMNVRALERMALESGLRRALEHGELVLHYQPIVDLASERVVGLEALVRWQEPERGLLLPDSFIPVAEESRLIVPLGEWVLCTACRQVAAWHRAGLGSPRLAVNLSVRQLQQADLVRCVEESLADSGLPPACLELEITESAAMQNVEWTQGVLQQLRRLGVGVSLDDFGTGQSSLSYLKDFPLSTLKIDRSFVRDITVDLYDEAIVKAVISLARFLDLRVVAEGVENGRQLAFLRAAGCQEGQGHLFSPPRPAEELEPVLEGMLK